MNFTTLRLGPLVLELQDGSSRRFNRRRSSCSRSRRACGPSRASAPRSRVAVRPRDRLAARRGTGAVVPVGDRREGLGRRRPPGRRRPRNKRCRPGSLPDEPHRVNLPRGSRARDSIPGSAAGVTPELAEVAHAPDPGRVRSRPSARASRCCASRASSRPRRARRGAASLAQLVANLREALAAEGLDGAASSARTSASTSLPADAARGRDRSRASSACSRSRSPSASPSRASTSSWASARERFARRRARAALRRARAHRRRARARRASSARDVERALGARAPARRAARRPRHPEVTVRVEVHRGAAHLFRDARRRARAGCRSASRAARSRSSRAASTRRSRRGSCCAAASRLDYVFCNLGGRTHELGALRVMKCIARALVLRRPPAAPRARLPARRRRSCCARSEPRYWQILLKREMLRAAEARGAAPRARRRS